MRQKTTIPTGLSRRALLARGAQAGGLLALAGAGGVLAACGDDEQSPAVAGADVTPEQVAAAGGTIKLLGWNYYEAPELNGPVRASWTYLTTSTELYTKTQQAGGFDLMMSNSADMPGLIGTGRLSALDPGLLANYENVSAELRDDPVFRGEDGSLYGVPFAYSYTYAMWKAGAVDAPKSFDDLLQPSLAKRVGILDEPLATIPVVARLAGFDPATLTSAQLDEVFAMLDELRPQIRTLHTIGAEVDLFARGDIVLDFPTVGGSLVFVEEAGVDADWDFLGSITYVDALSIPAGAGDPAASYAYIDHALTVPAQKGMVEQSVAYPAVAEAQSALPPELRKIDLTAALEAAPVLRIPSLDDREEWARRWSRFKASL